MRGDPPQGGNNAWVRIGSTPHARGSTLYRDRHSRGIRVYPACAGIHLSERMSFSVKFCLPRMRGDPPQLAIVSLSNQKSTPHARGSTLLSIQPVDSAMVYPACAGIHLSERPWTDQMRGLPRMRGDPPSWIKKAHKDQSSTPHARGSTHIHSSRQRAVCVYPACAGIHPSIRASSNSCMRLPRMRGDPPHFDRFIG